MTALLNRLISIDAEEISNFLELLISVIRYYRYRGILELQLRNQSLRINYTCPGRRYCLSHCRLPWRKLTTRNPGVLKKLTFILCTFNKIQFWHFKFSAWQRMDLVLRQNVSLLNSVTIVTVLLPILFYNQIHLFAVYNQLFYQNLASIFMGAVISERISWGNFVKSVHWQGRYGR